MGSYQPKKFGYLCTNRLGAMNVCFSRKRTFKQMKLGDSEGPLTARSGRSIKENYGYVIGS